MTTEVRKHYVRTSRGDVHVQQAGEGDRTVCLLTVTSFGGVLMGNVLPRLAALGYRALAVDVMGYGRSDKRQFPWRMETFADNIEEAVAGCGAPPLAYVCGHFSGLIGVELAARRPAHLEALVLDGTPLLTAERRAAMLEGPPPSPVAWTEDGAHAAEYWRMAWGVISRLDPQLTLPPQPSQMLRESYVALIDALAFEHGPGDAFAHFDAEARLRQVEVPTLCMCSDVDWNLPHHPTVVANIPNSRELRWPGTHPLHQWSIPQRAQDYVEAIDAFITDVTAPKAAGVIHQTAQ